MTDPVLDIPPHLDGAVGELRSRLSSYASSREAAAPRLQPETRERSLSLARSLRSAVDVLSAVDLQERTVAVPEKQVCTALYGVAETIRKTAAATSHTPDGWQRENDLYDLLLLLADGGTHEKLRPARRDFPARIEPPAAAEEAPVDPLQFAYGRVLEVAYFYGKGRLWLLLRRMLLRVLRRLLRSDASRERWVRRLLGSAFLRPEN